MLNPFLKNRQYFVTYSTVWMAVAVIQTVILNYYQDVDLFESIIDAAVFNFILAIISFSLWYILRFNINDQHNSFDLIINHLLTGIVTVAVWLGSGYYLMSMVAADNASYLEFLKTSFPWRAILGAFFYLIFVLIYYMMLYYEDLQQKLKVESELNNLVREAELNALKSQINPHFLFNSLNSISSLTMTDPEKAQEMVIKLSDFMRYSLSHDRNETTSLRRELENAERYLDIEKIRFGKRLKYVCNVPDNCFEQPIPNMILQPLLENAIKHGVHNSTEEVLIELSCVMTPDYAELHLLNDFDPEAIRPKGEGIGLKNIRNRMKLLYHRSDLFEVKMGKIEFEVILRIPKSKPA